MHDPEGSLKAPASQAGALDRTWMLIPARGGSVGIPRKNLVSCGGKPLIQYVIEVGLALLPADQVVVVTDDLEIADFARLIGASSILEERRSEAGETLDEKVVRNLGRMGTNGAMPHDIILTVQPTSPLLSGDTIIECVKLLNSGFASVLTVVEDRHLRWALSPGDGGPTALYTERKNRQDLEPTFRETGGVIGARLNDIESHGTRIIEPIGVVSVSAQEGIDIDTFGDLFEAEHWLSRGKVVIVADAGRELGMGHIYRALAIAYELARHDVCIAVRQEMPLSREALAGKPFRVFEYGDDAELAAMVAREAPDLAIFDILDTSLEYISQMKLALPLSKILTIENEGDGAELCDLGIYDLTPVPQRAPKVALSGSNFAIIAPSFELFYGHAGDMQPQADLMVSFGGSDPARLTERVLGCLEELDYQGKVTVVTGLGADRPRVSGRKIDVRYLENVTNMALVMGEHKLAVSSMGRTVFEFASIGVPVICFAQNEKEATHVHVGPQTGSVFGGLGYALNDADLKLALSEFLENSPLHRELVASSNGFRKKRNNGFVLGEALHRLGLGHME